MNGSDLKGIIDDDSTMILTDPKVLHCSACKGALASPVYQCSTGHAACNQCRENRQRCTYCESNIGTMQCLAIEKVMESIKLRCKHTRYGCREIIFYNHRSNHEDTCIYSPGTCPVLDCTFSTGSSEELGRHCTKNHPSSTRRFRYKASFEVWFDKDEQLIILQEIDEGLLFLLHNKKESYGNSITVTCIGTVSLEGKFFYQLVYRSKFGSALKFKSAMERVKGRQGAITYSNSWTEFLLVPSDFSQSSEELKLEVYIQRFV